MLNIHIPNILNEKQNSSFFVTFKIKAKYFSIKKILCDKEEKTCNLVRSLLFMSSYEVYAAILGNLLYVCLFEKNLSL